MNQAPNMIGKTGLQFFGLMTASISHEIKNVLAIMNENAGLIKDLALMAEKGRPLPLEKVKTIADRFGQQVSRADRIVKNLNEFSHSADVRIKTVDMAEAVQLLLALAHRFIAMKNVTIDFTPPAAACTIDTDPFYLTQLLWLCLEFAMTHTGKDPGLTIDCKTAESRVWVSFKDLDGLSEIADAHFPFSPEGQTIFKYLNAITDIDTPANALVVGLPFVLEDR